MKKLNVVCDGECQFCETCLYDESYKQFYKPKTKHIKEKQMEETYLGDYCNDCPFSKKKPLSHDKTKSNWLCEKEKIPIYGKGRTIALRVGDKEMVKAPDWCAFKKHKRSWYDIKPLNTFENLKINKMYHIPPIQGHKRRDIYIAEKEEKYIKYYDVENHKVVNYSPKWMYKYDLPIHFMAEIK